MGMSSYTLAMNGGHMKKAFNKENVIKFLKEKAQISTNYLIGAPGYTSPSGKSAITPEYRKRLEAYHQEILYITEDLENMFE